MNSSQNNFSIRKITKVNNKKGSIFKIINNKDHNFNKFGELYISEVFKNEIKAWKYHLRNELNLYVIEGRIKFVFAYRHEKKYLFDEIIIHKNSEKLIHIPKKTWFGFMGINNSNKILSLSSNLFTENEIIRKKVYNLKYNWIK